MEDRKSSDHSETSITTKENDLMMVYMKTTKTTPLQVSRSDTIKDVKTKLSNMVAVSPDMQELFFAGNHLKNSDRLVDYNIHDGSSIKMLLGTGIGMKIHVKVPPIGMITLDVNYWDTVRTVKAKIQEKAEGIATSQMVLVYTGKELGEGETLAYYNIQSGSTLYAICCGGDNIQIYVSTMTVRKVEIEIKPWYNVESVKMIIESILGIPTDQQGLKFNGKPMEDDKTLLYFNVQNGSSIEVILTVTFFVQMSTGKSIKMEMEHSDIVANLKRKIQEMEFIEPDKQVLVFNGFKLEDCKTLGYYNVQKLSTLRLFIRNGDEMQIFVRTPTGKTITINAYKSDTIDTLTDKIHKKEGIPKGRQMFIFAGKRLEGERSLAEFNIKSESTLDLRIRSCYLSVELQIFVKPLGETFTLTARLEDTIEDLKAKIQSSQGYPADKQELVFGGKKLKSSRKIIDYNIINNATLFLNC